MIYILDLLGVAVFAVTGAIIAGRKKMDVFGIMVVASVTALGGGTVRDLVIGARPVFWVDDPLYVVIAITAGIGTFVYVHFAKPPAKTLLIADAFGLAIFTVIGCQKAFQADASSLIVIFMGVVTGVTGGMIRDILCGEIPLILRREIYATASLAGGIVWVILYSRGIPAWMAVGSAGVTTLAIRLISLHWQLSLPVFMERKEK
jgi:uncharacterized membrane protein YeiH